MTLMAYVSERTCLYIKTIYSVSDLSIRLVGSNQNCMLKVYDVFPGYDRGIFPNILSSVINLLSTKRARDRTGRISALGLFCTHLDALCPC